MAGIARLRTDEPPHPLLLHHMRGPARDPRHGEDACHRLTRNAKRLEQHGSIIFHVGVDPVAGLCRPERGERRQFHLAREVDALIAIRQYRHRAIEDIGPRVAHAVDAVAEAHQPLAFRDLALQPGFDIVAGADLVQHVEHGARRAAMQRSLQGAKCPNDGRNCPRPGRCDDARRERRGVHAVIGHCHEIGIERFDLLGAGPLISQHTEEIVGMSGIRVRRNRGFPVPLPAERGGDNGGRAQCGERCADRGGDILVPGLFHLVAQHRKAGAKPFRDSCVTVR